MARILIGTSGWAYARWKGCFYPLRLPEKQRLSFYADRFPTTEINCSFYRIPSEHTYRKWATLVPSEFTFAVKANRIISHVGRLRNIQDTWQMFVRGVRNLGDAAGPVLVQLPPSFRLDLSCLTCFLEMASDRSSGIRIAIEFRHASWFTAETYRLLTQYEAALCIADGPRYPRCNVITTDFAYFRYHGRTPASAPYYPDEELRAEAQLVERFAKDGIDCYGYFNNDADGHAATNARRLNELLSDRQCAA